MTTANFIPNFGMVDRPNLCTYTLSKRLQDRPVDFQDVWIAATALVNKSRFGHAQHGSIRENRVVAAKKLIFFER